MADEFSAWLEETLEGLELDGPTYAVYVTGIMGEAEDDVEQRADNVCGLLSGATDEDLGDFRAALIRRWDAREGAAQALAAAQAAARAAALREASDKERAELERAQREKSARAAADAARSEGQRAQRERLLAEYGYDEDFVDEDGNVLAVPRENDAAALGVERNMNKAHIAEVAKAKREAAKAAHEAKVARDKEQQAREKAKREMAKARTVKQERKR
ncbi:hypothetical protein JKP88DRAFT_263064 [Tribonema minus]|uniref:CCDC43 PWI-like domain-containing protein n=1 Tax=Tribonema minus TaxID=303371 RepID=A0A835Z3Z1_9STRA|nr:hypothetical protein JKP88DRAFT_263064 [Tribonema minus]